MTDDDIEVLNKRIAELHTKRATLHAELAQVEAELAACFTIDGPVVEEIKRTPVNPAGFPTAGSAIDWSLSASVSLPAAPPPVPVIVDSGITIAGRKVGLINA